MKTNEEIIRIASEGSVTELVELNDWAVNNLREVAREKGGTVLFPSASELGKLVAQERSFIVGAGLGLVAYMKASREGMLFGINRRERRYVWAAVLTRIALGK